MVGITKLSNPSILAIVFAVFPPFWPLLIIFFLPLLYFIVSAELLANPQKLHTNVARLRDLPLFRRCTGNARSRTHSGPPTRPVIIAHRCGSGEAPENTIAAARQALASGATILHLDLHLTADKEIVCFHDQEPHERNMLKLTGRDASIRHFQYAHLPPLSSRIPVNPLGDLGAYIDTTKFGREGRKICRFQDMCEAFLDATFIIELWDDDPKLVQGVHNIIFSYRRSKSVIWGNRFSGIIQNECDRHDQVLPKFNTAPQWLWIYVAYYIGLLPFVPIQNFDVFNAVLINEERYRELLLGAVGESLQDFVFVILTVVVRIVNWFLKAPRLFKHLGDRGIPVVAFVVNDEDEWGYACANNFAGITTDYPRRLNSFVTLKAPHASPKLTRVSSASDVFLRHSEELARQQATSGIHQTKF